MEPSDVGIDSEALEYWLIGLDLGAEPPFRLRRIGAGKSNFTLLLEDAGDRRWILRRPPLGDLLPSAHDVAREARVLDALAGTGVGAPKAIALTEAPVCEAPLLLMEHVEGMTMDREETVRRLSIEARRAVGPSLVRRLGALHEVDLEAAGIADLSSTGHYGERQLRRWRRQWEKTKTREVAAVEEVAAELWERRPAQSETRLVHGDAHQLNCLIDPATGEVNAVIDWELCTLGEPLADLGTLLVYWSTEKDGSPLGDPYALTRLEGFSAPADLVDEYARVTGRDVSMVNYWRAFAAWKLAIIVEGVIRRRLENAANAEAIAPNAVERLLDQAAASL